MKKVFFLINLGILKFIDFNDVGEYLMEFLIDKYVIDLFFFIR